MSSFTYQVAFASSFVTLSFFSYSSGKTIRESDARVTHLLLDISIDQRAEDLQDRARQGIRPQMRHPRDRRRRGARADVHGCIKEKKFPFVRPLRD